MLSSRRKTTFEAYGSISKEQGDMGGISWLPYIYNNYISPLQWWIKHHAATHAVFGTSWMVASTRAHFQLDNDKCIFSG